MRSKKKGLKKKRLRRLCRARILFSAKKGHEHTFTEEGLLKSSILKEKYAKLVSLLRIGYILCFYVVSFWDTKL